MHGGHSVGHRRSVATRWARVFKRATVVRSRQSSVCCPSSRREVGLQARRLDIKARGLGGYAPLTAFACCCLWGGASAGQRTRCSLRQPTMQVSQGQTAPVPPPRREGRCGRCELCLDPFSPPRSLCHNSFYVRARCCSPNTVRCLQADVILCARS